MMAIVQMNLNNLRAGKTTANFRDGRFARANAASASFAKGWRNQVERRNAESIWG